MNQKKIPSKLNDFYLFAQTNLFPDVIPTSLSQPLKLINGANVIYHIKFLAHFWSQKRHKRNTISHYKCNCLQIWSNYIFFNHIFNNVKQQLCSLCIYKIAFQKSLIPCRFRGTSKENESLIVWSKNTNLFSWVAKG